MEPQTRVSGALGSPQNGQQAGAVPDHPSEPFPRPTAEKEPVEAHRAPIGGGLRSKKKLEWVEVEDEAYEGYKFKLWVNYPQRLDEEMKSGDEDRIRAAFTQVVLEHNGWCDTDGNPYPPADTPAFWQEIPNELVRAVTTLIFLQAGKLQDSLLTKYRNTRRF